MQDTTMNSWQEKCTSFLHKKAGISYNRAQDLIKTLLKRCADVERVLLYLNFPLDTPSRGEYIVFLIL